MNGYQIMATVTHTRFELHSSMFLSNKKKKNSFIYYYFDDQFLHHQQIFKCSLQHYGYSNSFKFSY